MVAAALMVTAQERNSQSFNGDTFKGIGLAVQPVVDSIVGEPSPQDGLGLAAVQVAKEITKSPIHPTKDLICGKADQESRTSMGTSIPPHSNLKAQKIKSFGQRQGQPQLDQDALTERKCGEPNVSKNKKREQVSEECCYYSS
ncbi:hypothetical protein QJS10_CPB15g01223 [Acorus calamus]|uniref:Uncharacterized protein n=1 Tax=Acorus calamus TaxID=4465 RepID=A0AAV9D709_ACOCL|nr:hypothetical protein QJS10_CPB15g01223 [Acorus calamus]